MEFHHCSRSLLASINFEQLNIYCFTLKVQIFLPKFQRLCFFWCGEENIKKLAQEYILDRAGFRFKNSPLSWRLRRIGLWVMRRSMTFCLRAERTFKLGSEAEIIPHHHVKHSSVFLYQVSHNKLQQREKTTCITDNKWH